MIRSSFLAVFRKEFLHIRRDRSTLAMALSIPVFQLLLFGFIDTNVTALPTVVVDQDQSSYSRALISSLQATKTFEISEITRSPERARGDVIAGRARVAVVIPPTYRADRAYLRPAEISVLIDGSDSNVSAQALGAVNGVAQNTSVGDLAGSRAPTLSVRPVILFNPSGRTANFIIPGLIAILLQIVAMVLAAVAIVREKEQGTYEQLVVTPVDPVGLILGKLAPYLAIGMAEMVIVLTLMRFGFGVPIRGNLLLLFGAATIYLFALLSLGLLVSTRAQTQSQAQQMAQLFLLPSIFLSGYIFPVQGLPAPLYWLGRLLPATHMIEVLRGVILRDAGVMELLPHIGALCAISAAFVALGVSSFQRTAR